MNFPKRKRTVSGGASLQTDPSSRQKVHKLFEKKFSYSKPADEEWEIPNLTLEDLKSNRWEASDTEALKVLLNNIKDQLSDKDISLWHEHTNFMNLAGSVIKELQSRFRPDLCTQAWCKFYEIVSSYEIVDLSSVVFNSVHLCEAPGAFITSLNHYLYSNGLRGFWNWVGTTLNPYHEGNSTSAMIMDDRFIQNSLDNWDFGVDGTGNIMKWYNVQHLMDRCSDLGPIHLVTCDGSIDCQDMPSDQETVVSRLHCCEALAAMLILAPGGTLILKKFTMFEEETTSLMYLLNCCFQQVHVFKPATSKSGNSEVYVICKGFSIDREKHRLLDFSRLYFTNEDPDKGLIFGQNQIPSSFLTQHKSCCECFVMLQRNAISHNLDHYPSVSEKYLAWIDSMRDYCADYYINKYNVKKIPNNCRVMPATKKSKLSKEARKECNNCLQKMHTGTFQDRQKLCAMPWDQTVHHIARYNDIKTQVTWVEILGQEVTENKVEDWACSEEVPVSNLFSSAFCEPRVLKLSQEITHKAQVQKYQESFQRSSSLATVGLVLKILTAMMDSSENSKFNVIILSDDHSQDNLHYNNKIEGATSHGNKICKEGEELDVKSCTEGEEPMSHDDVINSEMEEITDHLINKVFHQTYSSLSPVCEGNTVFYIDLCPPICTCETDIHNQPHLVRWLHHCLQKMQINNTLLLKITPCLSRFTAGLVFLLCHCFSKVGFLPHPAGSTLQQILVCYQFIEAPYWLFQHLQYVEHRVKGHHKQPSSFSTGKEDNTGERYDCGSNVLVETVPMQVLSLDAQFVMSMRRSNGAVLKSFVNIVGEKEKELYSGTVGDKEKQLYSGTVGEKEKQLYSGTVGDQ